MAVASKHGVLCNVMALIISNCGQIRRSHGGGSLNWARSMSSTPCCRSSDLHPGEWRNLGAHPRRMSLEEGGQCRNLECDEHSAGRVAFASHERVG